MKNKLIVDDEFLAALFNLWAAKYAADPSQFGQVLDAQGQPVTDYGQIAAAHFMKLALELDDACVPLSMVVLPDKAAAEDFGKRVCPPLTPP